MEINNIFEKYILKNKKEQKNNNYYSKKVFWREFFYENIEYIPYITYIGIFWSLQIKKNWDSNEGARGKINNFFEEINHFTKISKSNGFPIYQLFHYLDFNTPSKLKKYNILIADTIEKNYFEFFYLIFEYINNVITKHIEYLRSNFLFSKNSYLNRWKKQYQNIIDNKSDVKKILENINRMFNLTIFR